QGPGPDRQESLAPPLGASIPYDPARELHSLRGPGPERPGNGGVHRKRDVLNPWSVLFHELVVAPAALLGAWVMGVRALGRRRAAVELVALALYGYMIELVAMRVFGSHSYGTEWLLAPLGVPLAVAAVWAAVILAAMGLAARLGPAS